MLFHNHFQFLILLIPDEPGWDKKPAFFVILYLPNFRIVVNDDDMVINFIEKIRNPFPDYPVLDKTIITRKNPCWPDIQVDRNLIGIFPLRHGKNHHFPNLVTTLNKLPGIWPFVDIQKIHIFEKLIDFQPG